MASRREQELGRLLPKTLILMGWLEPEFQAHRIDRLGKPLLPFNFGHPNRLLCDLGAFPNKRSHIKLRHLPQILLLGDPYNKTDTAVWCLGLHE